MGPGAERRGQRAGEFPALKQQELQQQQGARLKERAAAAGATACGDCSMQGAKRSYSSRSCGSKSFRGRNCSMAEAAAEQRRRPYSQSATLSLAAFPGQNSPATFYAAATSWPSVAVVNRDPPAAVLRAC